MSIQGWYYLHQNNTLIYKRDFDETVSELRESTFVKHIWPFDEEDREGAWNILVEAQALGLDKNRVDELVQKWSCTDEDANIYADRVGCKLQLDGNSWHAMRNDFLNLQESLSGFGDSKLDAMSNLCKELGFQPSKMWGHTFKSLLNK